VTAERPRAASGDRGWRPLALILLAGAAVRGLLWLWFEGHPLAIWDERDYHALATGLLERGEFGLTPGHPTSIRPPLYPAFLAAVYWVAGGPAFDAVRLLQSGLSLLTAVLLYHLGREVFSPRTGLWLAGFYAFYPSLLGFNNLLLTETLFTFLLTAACYGLVRALRTGSLAWLAAAGALLGLGALTRSVLWYLPPLCAVLLLVAWRGSTRRRLAAAGVLLVVFAGTVAPWSIRNTRLEGTFVAIDSMGGRNFMMGNYRFTPLFRAWDAIALEGDRSWFHELRTTYPRSAWATQGLRDKLALRQGLRFVIENPGLTLKRDLVKLVQFWGLERELVAGASRGLFGPLPPGIVVLLAGIIMGSYAGLLVLAVFGALVVPPADRRLHWLLLLVVGLVCAVHTVVFGHSRYHLPVMPLLLAYAANAVVLAGLVWRRRREPSFRVAGLVAALLVAGWGLEVLWIEGHRSLTVLGQR
jgi:4-amino-4-deoxy-L-arabinose transferase-like glycosyltransferase